MSQRKRPFSPSFLNRLDDYLLKNAPEIWSARAHLVVYYGLLFMSVLAFFSFIVPDDPRGESEVAYWIVFVTLLSIIGLVVWLLFLLRFNVFKRYGITSPLNRLKSWLLYFVSVSTIVFFCFVPAIIESVRANMAYSDDELATDINRMNTIICKLSYDSLPHEWSNDTNIVVNSTEGRYYQVNEEGEESYASTEAVPTEVIAQDSVVKTAVYKPAFTLIDTMQFNNKKLAGDSLVQLNDSVYIFSECPSYVFITDPGLNEYATVHVLDSEDLFNQIIRHYKPLDKTPLMEEMQELSIKYKYKRYGQYENYTSYEIGSKPSIQDRFLTGNISDSIDNIHDRKHSFNSSNLNWQIRVLFYISFIITLLVFNFRHSTKQAFFLSLLTSVLLSILTGLILAFSSGEESSMFGSYWFYLAFFTFFSLSVFQQKKRNIVVGISINLFSWMIYFLPLVIVAMYYSDLEQQYRSEAYTNYSIDYDAMQLHFLYAELIGIAIFILAVPTLLHRLYRRWYALPEE